MKDVPSKSDSNEPDNSQLENVENISSVQGLTEVNKARTDLDKELLNDLKKIREQPAPPWTNKEDIDKSHAELNTSIHELENKIANEQLRAQETEGDIPSTEQDLIKEISPDISDSDHEKLKEILGPEFESRLSIKESFINKWESGEEKPVKIVPSEQNIQEKVSGYFTEERFIKGRTPEEMEKSLGFAEGRLKNGATIYEFEEIPNENQFTVEGYTHMMPKDKTGNSQDFVPGTGINQFELTEPVKAKVVGEVKYGEAWNKGVKLKEENLEQQSKNNEIVTQPTERPENNSTDNSAEDQDQDYDYLQGYGQ